MTFFAPAERAGADQLVVETRAVRESPLVCGVLEAVEDPLLVLNGHRQVLLANGRAAETLGRSNVVDAGGQRPGELLGCIHSDEGPGGCGTAEACRYCGALQAVLSAEQSKQPETRECLMTIRRRSVTEAVEFRVRATPFHVGRHEFITVLLQDISGEKRREALERIFFHDLMNTIGGLIGWSETLLSMKGRAWEDAAERIGVLADRLAQEVRDQRTLFEAESGELMPLTRACRIGEVYDALRDVFSENPVVEERTLVLGSDDDDRPVITDPALLDRALVNLVKNALEATPAGGRVRVWHSRDDGLMTFHVWNIGAMPDNVVRRVFQRSFSTKAEKGRGLGTYSAKLLVERYLGGSVTFRSTAEEGTVFLIELPERAPVPKTVH